MEPPALPTPSPRLALALGVLLLLPLGCATTSETQAPPMPNPSDPEVSGLLSQASSQFAVANGPASLNVLDASQVDWHADKSMSITLHQIWATKTTPAKPLPPLGTFDLDSETFTLNKLQLYDLNPNGYFVQSSTPVSLQWSPPASNLPLSLSSISTARLPELKAGEALEVKYTLETKTSTMLKDRDLSDFTKPRPISVEPSFAFLWNGYTPSLQKGLDIRMPKDFDLFATRLRLPSDMSVTETASGDFKTVSFSEATTQAPLPLESFQPPLQDLAPLTAFTTYKRWEDAVLPYRKRVKQVLDEDPKPVEDLIGDAGSNTSMALSDRLAEVKAAISDKVDFVDTGLPIYLDPDRPVSAVIASGKGTAHDLAMLLAAAIHSLKIDCQVYLYRKSDSGELLGDLPALAQFDGVLVAVPTDGGLIWMDPTEPLAAPGVLPLNALDREALPALLPLAWKTTPGFTAKDHRKERDVNMTFDGQGNLTCTVDLVAYGSSELSLRQFFRQTDDATRRDLVLKGLTKRFPGVSLTDYRFGDYRDLSKPLDVHYTFQIPNYGTFTNKGDFQFYPLVFEDVEDFFTVLQDDRKTPVVIPQNFNSVTRVVVKLPDGYQVNTLPKDASLANPVAEFIAHSKLDFGTLSYERYLGLKERIIAPGADYQDLLEFYQVVLSQDRVPFVAQPVNGKDQDQDQ